MAGGVGSHGEPALEGPVSGPSASDALRQQGNDAFKKREYGAAVELYTCALDNAEPSSRAAILSNRAMALYRQGRYAECAADGEASLALDGSGQKARYRAALAHLMLGRPREAQPLVAALLEQATGAAEPTQPGAPASAALPPYLATLRGAAAAMLRHDTHRAQLAAGGGGLQPEGAARVMQLLCALSDDMEGEADADIAAVLGELSQLLLGGDRWGAGGSARAAFEAHNGYPLVLCYLTEAYCSQAAAVLRAASGWRGPAACGEGQQQRQQQQEEEEEERSAGVVMWPPLVWQRLLSTALASGGSSHLATAAVQLLCWAAGDPWARTQLLAHPLPTAPAVSHGGMSSGSAVAATPLEQVAGMLQGLPATATDAAVVAAAAELLGRYGVDAASAEALGSLRLRPQHTLLHAFQAAEDLLASPQQLPVTDNSGGAPISGASRTEGGSSSINASILAGEEEALEELRERQRGVYDAQVVALRRAVLRALCALCDRPELVAAEAGRAGGGKARAKQADSFVADLLRLARTLHEQSPKRTCAVLGADGRPKSYSKRPFAADFKDNPAGDFLVGLDLASATPATPLDCDAASAVARQLGSAAEPTLLELAADALLRLAGGSTALAGQLYRLDVLGLCEALWGYSTLRLGALAQRLCAAVAKRHPAAFSELLVDGSTMGLASILQFTALPDQLPPGSAADLVSHQPQQQAQQQQAAAPGGSAQPAGGGSRAAAEALQLLAKATDKLGALVDGCSGDEFAHLTLQPGGALQRAFLLASTPGAAAKVVPKEAQQPQLQPQAGGSSQGGAGAMPPPAPAAATEAGKEEGAAQAADEAAVAAKLQAAAARFVKVCADRAQRQQGLQRWQRPRGGAWERLDVSTLLAMLPPKEGSGGPAAAGGGGSQAAPANSNAEQGGAGSNSEGGAEGKGAAGDDPRGEGLAKLRKGFLASSSSAAKRTRPKAAQEQEARMQPFQQAAAAPAVAAAVPHAAQQPRVVIEDITEQQPAPGEGQPAAAAAAPDPAEQAAAQERAQRAQREAWQAQQAWLAQQEAEEAEAGEESDVEDLADVYDSTPSLEFRQIRNAWMAVPLSDKLRWDQTSTDVNVWVVMPRGTRARDVKVSIQPGQLTVSLGWYGRVVDGQLHRRAKASEAQWCMEDYEVHVILPKDDRSYWKALFVDGEERSYYQLLQEAVNADEPVTAYDDMDERSKDLLDQMLERQAMIKEGLIDLDGFDDFRVVIGENSLVQR